jgi:hypothetical protein
LADGVGDSLARASADDRDRVAPRALHADGRAVRDLRYWSFYWDPIRAAAILLAGQIVFAYAFDMLLTWSRRDTHLLTFGPFPIIFSINLFLRFRDDLFALQFVMVAIGFLAKEFIRWNKDGRRVHIFNRRRSRSPSCRLSSCSRIRRIDVGRGYRHAVVPAAAYLSVPVSGVTPGPCSTGSV